MTEGKTPMDLAAFMTSAAVATATVFAITLVLVL
jgi:hypothetical protein